MPVNFRVKYKIKRVESPKNAFNNINLKSFRLLKAKIKIAIRARIKAVSKKYFKNIIKSPNIIVVTFNVKNEFNLKMPPREFGAA